MAKIRWCSRCQREVTLLDDDPATCPVCSSELVETVEVDPGESDRETVPPEALTG